MKYLLDTCVISEFARSRPNASVIDWLCRQDAGTQNFNFPKSTLETGGGL